jgi:hypothetical protein
MLTDPHDDLAEENMVATALTGLAGLARMVRTLAAVETTGSPSPAPAPADELVHLLVAVAHLGEAAARLAGPVPDTPPNPRPSGPQEWLR